MHYKGDLVYVPIVIISVERFTFADTVAILPEQNVAHIIIFSVVYAF